MNGIFCHVYSIICWSLLLWNIFFLFKIITFYLNIFYSCDQSYIFSIITHSKKFITHSSEIILICCMTVWMSFFCWTQRKIFWRKWETEQFWGTIDSHSIYFSYHGNQWCPKTAWLQTFFKISSFVFSRTKKFIQVWGCVNDIFIFGWTIPLVLLFSMDTLNWSKVMIKTFLMLQKIYISDKCCSSELSIHQRNLKKILLSCFQQNNNNNTYFWAANQNDRIMWLE